MVCVNRAIRSRMEEYYVGDIRLSNGKPLTESGCILGKSLFLEIPVRVSCQACRIGLANKARLRDIPDRPNNLIKE